MSKESISQVYIIIQFLLSLTTLVLISLIQVLIAIYFNNSTSSTIFSIFAIAILGILSKFNTINPIMLSKNNIIDNRLEVYPRSCEKMRNHFFAALFSINFMNI